jgi:S-layer homology domain
VPPSNVFFGDITDLYQMGAISGYPDGLFRPGNNAHRGHISKIVTLAFDVPPCNSCTQHFPDVPPSHHYFGFIEAAYAQGWVSGYPDGTFRAFNLTTRGQTAKIVVQASGYALKNPATATFSDVPPGSTFFQFVETAYANGMLAGYPDGTFRPNVFVTRGQLSQITVIGSWMPGP